MYIKFEDFYKKYPIKHLVLHEFNGKLISPCFATDQCKDYSRFMVYDGYFTFINSELPPATSKYNACCNVNGSMYSIPYGIYDSFNCITELDKDFNTVIHYIDMPGKGQFYSVASNGETAFSFPLGYSDTSYGIYIDNGIHLIPIDKKNNTKLHMGTVYCNGKYYSMPRGDAPGYVDLVSYDGKTIESYPLNIKNPEATRKYSDILVIDNKLYSMPYGELDGVNQVVVFDTDTSTHEMFDLAFPDSPKKFNTFIRLSDKIVGMPYGDEWHDNSNKGIVWDINTKETEIIDLGDLSFGGKYRFRSGINYKDCGYFFNTGSPNCPIIKINSDYTIEKKFINGYLFGRPLLYKDKMCVIGFNLETYKHYIFKFDSDLLYEQIEIPL